MDGEEGPTGVDVERFVEVFQSIQIFKVGDVALNRRDIAADGGLRFIEFRLATPRDKHVRAFLDEQLGRRQTNPAAAACIAISVLIVPDVGYMNSPATCQLTVSEVQGAEEECCECA